MAVLLKKNRTSIDPEISIVIGTLNRPEILLKLLKQLDQSPHSLEVLVYDQSSEESYEKIQPFFKGKKNFSLTHFKVPNTCKYLNAGWKDSKSDIVLYLDDDVSITDETLQAHIDGYSNPHIKAVAGRVINDGEKVVESNQVGKIHWFGASFSKNFSSTTAGVSDFPYGCNMSYRKSVLSALGGFDEKLSGPVFAFNEVDMGYRIAKQFKDSILFEPKALVYHHRFPSGGTRSFTMEEGRYSIEFNYGYFLGKNYSLFENIIMMIRRLPFQIIKEPQHINAIVKGFIKGKRV